MLGLGLDTHTKVYTIHHRKCLLELTNKCFYVILEVPEYLEYIHNITDFLFYSFRVGLFNGGQGCGGVVYMDWFAVEINWVSNISSLYSQPNTEVQFTQYCCAITLLYTVISVIRVERGRGGEILPLN